MSSTISLSKKIGGKVAEKAAGSLYKKFKGKKAGEITLEEQKELIREVLQEDGSLSVEKINEYTNFAISEISELINSQNTDIATLQQQLEGSFMDTIHTFNTSIMNEFLEFKEEMTASLNDFEEEEERLIQRMQELSGKKVKAFQRFNNQIDSLTREIRQFIRRNVRKKSLVAKSVDRLLSATTYANKWFYSEFLPGEYFRKAIKHPKTPKNKLLKDTITKVNTILKDHVIKDREYPISKLKFSDYLIIRSSYNPHWEFQNEKPELLKNKTKTREIQNCSDCLISEAAKWGYNNNERKKFVKGFESMFYSLTEKPPGSMVRLSDAIRLDEFGVPENSRIKKATYEKVVHGFLLLLEHRGIALPTPFHKDLKAFEVVPDLINKFKAET
ncbi:MAG: hypothetical protein GPJ54_07980 [Candidatus Heimdallarchaeota archaeon]|nr:hypothetical protein [Candidatus Heimdallarchaeota archaeon]